MILVDHRLAGGMQLRRQVGHFVQRSKLLRASCGGLTGMGWVGEALSLATGEGGTGVFGDAEDRLAGDAVEDEQQRALVHRRHGGDGLAVLASPPTSTGGVSRS